MNSRKILIAKRDGEWVVGSLYGGGPCWMVLAKFNSFEGARFYSAMLIKANR